MKPKQFIKTQVKLFNDGKAESKAQLDHEDAINHQVADEPVNR